MSGRTARNRRRWPPGAGSRGLIRLHPSRPGEIPDSGGAATHRYLVVGGRRLDEPSVREAIGRRAARGRTVFHVIVPATCSAETRRLVAMAGDPLSGYVGGALTGLEQAMERDQRAAAGQLDRVLRLLGDAGAEATGEVGRADPFQVIGRALGTATYDEVVVAVASTALERFLRLDLPRRLRRSWEVPVVELGAVGSAPGDPPAAG